MTVAHTDAHGITTYGKGKNITEAIKNLCEKKGVMSQSELEPTLITPYFTLTELVSGELAF